MMAKSKEEQEQVKRAAWLVANYSPLELANMVVQVEAGNDLLGRLAEEVGEKLQTKNERIAILMTENVMLKTLNPTLKLDLKSSMEQGQEPEAE